MLEPFSLPCPLHHTEVSLCLPGALCLMQLSTVPGCQLLFGEGPQLACSQAVAQLYYSMLQGFWL